MRIMVMPPDATSIAIRTRARFFKTMIGDKGEEGYSAG
jgi:hypothetical protein